MVCPHLLGGVPAIETQHAHGMKRALQRGNGGDVLAIVESMRL